MSLEYSLLSCMYGQEYHSEIRDADPEIFAEPNNQYIFRAFKVLIDDGLEIDENTLFSKVKDLFPNTNHGKIRDILEGTCAEFHIGNKLHPNSYIIELKEKHRLRQITDLTKTLHDRATKGSTFSDILIRIQQLDAMKDNIGYESSSIIAQGLITDMDTKDFKDLIGYDTGFQNLNNITLGLYPGMHVLMGRPSMGKTAFSLNLTMNLARTVPVLYFSLEMTKESLMRRLISSMTGIDFKRLRLQNIYDQEWDILTKAYANISQQKLFINDFSGTTPEDIRSISREFKRTHPDFVIFIDYLQLIQTKGRFDNRFLEVSHISSSIKAISKEINIPIIVLTQMSRDCEKRQDKRPQMSDAKESGGIEQDSDIIMGIFRPAKYKEEEDYPGQTFVEILKQRDGETGILEYEWNGAQQRFVERASKW